MRQSFSTLFAGLIVNSVCVISSWIPNNFYLFIHLMQLDWEIFTTWSVPVENVVFLPECHMDQEPQCLLESHLHPGEKCLIVQTFVKVDFTCLGVWYQTFHPHSITYFTCVVLFVCFVFNKEFGSSLWKYPLCVVCIHCGKYEQKETQVMFADRHHSWKGYSVIGYFSGVSVILTHKSHTKGNCDRCMSQIYVDPYSVSTLENPDEKSGVITNTELHGIQCIL